MPEPAEENPMESQASGLEPASPGALDDPSKSSGPATVPFGSAFRFWLKLGFISFGGPAGQIAIMHAELVDRKRWISERRFLHALNYCMVLPGPEAQQLATYIGWLLHGTWGGIVAGALFVLPSLFVLLGLTWAYMAFGNVPALQGIFYGMKPAVVAVVAFAVMRLARRAIKNEVTLALAALAFLALFFTAIPFPLVILGAGILGLLGAKLAPSKFLISAGHQPSQRQGTPLTPAVIDDHHESLPHTRFRAGRFAIHLQVGLLLWLTPMALLFLWQGWQGTYCQMGWFFTQAALVTFGGAYAVLPFVAQQAVDVYGWLRPGQMIDGLALGETTPGPLIMVVTFVGFVGGWHKGDLGWQGALLGGCVATYFTFLPSFLFILLGAPFIEHMRGELRWNAALSGITAAVVGVVLNLAVFFGQNVFFPANQPVDGWALGLAAVAFMLLWRFKVNVVYVVLGCGLAGWVVFSIK